MVESTAESLDIMASVRLMLRLTPTSTTESTALESMATMPELCPPTLWSPLSTSPWLLSTMLSPLSTPLWLLSQLSTPVSTLVFMVFPLSTTMESMVPTASVMLMLRLMPTPSARLPMDSPSITPMPLDTPTMLASPTTSPTAMVAIPMLATPDTTMDKLHQIQVYPDV